MAAGAVTAPLASALTTAASGPSVRPASPPRRRAPATRPRALRLDSREQLKVKDVVTDRDGSTHVRYERTFAGLRVIGGDFVVHRTGAGAVRDGQLERLRQGRRRLHHPPGGRGRRARHRLEDRGAGQEADRRRARGLRRRGHARGSRTTCS